MSSNSLSKILLFLMIRNLYLNKKKTNKNLLIIYFEYSVPEK